MNTLLKSSHVTMDDLVASATPETSAVFELRDRLMKEKRLSYLAASNLATRMLADVAKSGVAVRMTSGAEAVQRFDTAVAALTPKAAPVAKKSAADILEDLRAELV